MMFEKVYICLKINIFNVRVNTFNTTKLRDKSSIFHQYNRQQSIKFTFIDKTLPRHATETSLFQQKMTQVVSVRLTMGRLVSFWRDVWFWY